MAVDKIFTESGYKGFSVSLGEVSFPDETNEHDLKGIDKKLKELGFEIIEDHKSRIIEKIKNIIIELIHNSDGELKYNFSDIIVSRINMNYNYLSNLFSSIEGTTIEKFIILQKIEKVKELLAYNELTLNEIAYKLGYSSTAHLSNQFKKETGLTPTFFKEIGQNKRRMIDEIK